MFTKLGWPKGQLNISRLMAFFRTSRSLQSAWKRDEGTRAASATNVTITRGQTQKDVLPLLALRA